MRRSTLLPALLLTLVSLLTGCGKDGGGSQADTPQSAFDRLEDSVRAYSPHAPQMADSMLAEAKDSMDYYLIYIRKGMWQLNNSSVSDALSAARRVRRFAQGQPPSPETSYLIALGANLEGACYRRQMNRRQETIRLLTVGLDHAIRSSHKQIAPDLAANLADAYVAVYDMPKAARYYRRALFLVDSLHLPEEYNTTLYLGLGQIYTTLEDYESALHFYRLTERLYDKMEVNMQLYFLNNFGNYYYFKGDYANALRMFKRMEACLDSHGQPDSYARAYCQANLADTYLNLSKPDSAEACIGQAVRFFEANKVADGLYYANTIRIGIALNRHDYAAVKPLLAEGSTLTSIDQNLQGIRRRYLTRYYAATGDFAKAYALSQADKLRGDSAEHKKQNMRASEIMSRFTEDTLRLHFALEMGERSAEVAESRAALYLTLFVLAVIVMGSAVAWNVQRKRKAQTELDMFKLRLTTVRQRISPHFVFNVINAKLSNVPKEEGDQLVSMAKLIRKNLELTGKTFVPLSEEMDFVDRYVSLQSSLIAGGIDYVRVLPEEPGVLEGIIIPSMFVQILVENAIKHGLRNATGEKRLTVSVEASPELTTITVADTGPGFDIRRRSKDSTRSGLSIIRGTMAVVNKNNRRADHIAFDIGNTHDPEGRTTGCRATLTIPRGMRPL